jgi:hypothetical protein
VKIRNGQVKSPDVARGAIGPSALAPGAVGASALASGAVGGGALAPGAVGAAALGANSVGSGNVQNNSLKGTDIDEASLLGVNAQTLGGTGHCGKALRITVSTSQTKEQTLCAFGPFTVKAVCEASAGEEVSAILNAETTENDSFLSNGADPSEWPSDEDWDSGETWEIVRQNEYEEGNGPFGVTMAIPFNAFAPSGAWMSGQASARGDALAGGLRNCDFVISAFG